MYVHVHVHTCACTCTYMCMYMYMCMYVPPSSHIHINTHVHVGKRLDSIRKTLNSILMEAIDYRHVVVLLDDLDEVAQNITDIQREAAGEGMANTRVAQGILYTVSIHPFIHSFCHPLINQSIH